MKSNGFINNVMEYAGDVVTLTVSLAATTSLAFMAFKAGKEAYKLKEDLDAKWDKKLKDALK